jgi:rod shape-determining protein MreB
MVSVASALSGDDRRGILDALSKSGTRTAYMIDVPLAAAIGAGLDVASREGSLVVDAGAGCTHVAVIALEGTVAGAMLPLGGATMDRAIAERVAAAHGVALEPGVARMLKEQLGSALPPHEERVLRVAARRGGAEEWVTVSSYDVSAAVRPMVDAIADAVRRTLEDTPRSLLNNVVMRGAALTGGGAKLQDLGRCLGAVAGMSFRLTDDAEGATLRGCASALDNLDLLKRNFLYIR